MTVENKKAEQCCGCSTCVEICPEKCVIMNSDNEGFLYPMVNKESCINCGLCEEKCRFSNKYSSKEKAVEVLGAYSKNTEERQNSSSGGIFSLLAKRVIQKNGVVFGVAMSDDCKSCRCIMVDKIEDLRYLRGSKYFQAEVGNVYRDVEKYLNDGRSVLFSGTPCQVSGLYAVLGKKYDNLITIDVVCHGVPSPKFWREYLDSEEREKGSALKQVNFRSKAISWEKFGLKETFADHTERFEDLSNSFYLQCFLNNLCLRPSCYNCGVKRTGDITLGDLWGTKKMFPQIFEESGTSLVLINTEKGKDAFNLLNSDLVSDKVNYASALRMNPCIETSVVMPCERNEFFKDLDTLSFEKLKSKYTKLFKRKQKKRAHASVVYYTKRALIKIRDLVIKE